MTRAPVVWRALVHVCPTSEKEKRMSAITAALSQIDGVAAEGDLVPEPTAALELATPGEPILLPDGKRIYPPCLHGAPVDELALALLDMDDPAKSTFLRLIGPPGAGQEPDRPRDRLPPLDRPGPRCRRPARRPVLRVRRAAARSVVRRVLLPLRLRPGRRERRPGERWSTRRSCRRCARGGW